MSVFHLKYRPQLLSELDSKSVRENLVHILGNEDIPQVYLFCGPKGSGKTSAARILAKVVNCSKKKNGEACGKCDSCKSIAQGNCLDVIEMDAASNRGIDDVRLLKEKTYLLPTQLKRKVFIIDEVHMMTKEAFNALLKILEEPPIHTIFILCTTDPEKIPETVLSRLIRIDFKKGVRSEMKDSLKRVINGEDLKIDEKVVEMIIERSEGSFRNAQKLLTELVMSCGRDIKEAKVEDLSWFSFQNYGEDDLAADLTSGRKKQILDALEKLSEKGVDMVTFRQRLVWYFQNQLLLVNGILKEEIGKKVVAMSEGEISEWLRLLILAGKQEREAVVGQLPLQLAVVEYLKNKSKKSDSLKVESQKSKESDEKEKEVTKKVMAIKNLVSIEEVEKLWIPILNFIKPRNHTVEAFLRAARPIKVEGDMVEIEVFYPFHKDKLEEAKNRVIVEIGISEIVGKELRVKCSLGKLKRSKEPVVLPVEEVTTSEIDSGPNGGGGDIYQIAKEIFG